MAPYASNDAFRAELFDFFQWLRERPDTTISRKIEIIDMRHHNAGRGIGKGSSSESVVSMFAQGLVAAVKDVEEDEELFSIAQPNVLYVFFGVHVSFLETSFESKHMSWECALPEMCSIARYTQTSKTDPEIIMQYRPKLEPSKSQATPARGSQSVELTSSRHDL